jgi:2-iminoacetate synthase ThiH
MALEEVWSTAASGYTEAITEFHIVGGLHADLPFQYYIDLIAGLKERFPQGAPQGVHHGRDRLLLQDRQDERRARC